MANVIVTHGVGDMEIWLKGGADRQRLFAPYCSSYSIYRQEGTNRVAIRGEIDVAKMQAAISTPEMQAAMQAHTVIPPLEIFVESPGQK